MAADPVRSPPSNQEAASAASHHRSSRLLSAETNRENTAAGLNCRDSGKSSGWPWALFSGPASPHSVEEMMRRVIRLSGYQQYHGAGLASRTIFNAMAPAICGVAIDDAVGNADIGSCRWLLPARTNVCASAVMSGFIRLLPSSCNRTAAAKESNGIGAGVQGSNCVGGRIKGWWI